MSKQHEVESLDFEGDWMTLRVDGQVYRLPLAQVSDRLANASEADRKIYWIAPSGYGIHWTTLDEDLSVNAIISDCDCQSLGMAAKKKPELRVYIESDLDKLIRLLAALH